MNEQSKLKSALTFVRMIADQRSVGACKQLAEDAAADIEAALAAQPVESAEPVAWCSLTNDGKIEYFDGKPMVMPGPVGNEHHTTPLVVAPPAARKGWRPMPFVGPMPRCYLVANAKGQVAPHLDGVIHNTCGSAWDWNYGEAITHWQPLPAPPEQP